MAGIEYDDWGFPVVGRDAALAASLAAARSPQRQTLLEQLQATPYEAMPQQASDPFLAMVLSSLPGVGDAFGVGADAAGYASGEIETTWGNLAMTALGALPFVPGAGVMRKVTGVADDLPMDEASRLARAREQGFDVYPRPFYSGQVEGLTEFDPDAWFARDRAYAEGKAALPGRSLYEVLLAPERPFNARQDVTAGTWADIARSMTPAYPGATEEFISGFPGSPAPASLADLEAIAAHLGDEPVLPAPLMLQLLRHRADVENAMRGAGYDAIDYGDHLQMLTADSIRSTSARFDPAKRSSRNIFATVAPYATAASLGTAAAGMYESE